MVGISIYILHYDQLNYQKRKSVAKYTQQQRFHNTNVQVVQKQTSYSLVLYDPSIQAPGELFRDASFFQC